VIGKIKFSIPNFFSPIIFLQFFWSSKLWILSVEAAHVKAEHMLWNVDRIGFSADPDPAF
jgi:hypothetical protein